MVSNLHLGHCVKIMETTVSKNHWRWSWTQDCGLCLGAFQYLVCWTSSEGCKLEIQACDSVQLYFHFEGGWKERVFLMCSSVFEQGGASLLPCTAWCSLTCWVWTSSGLLFWRCWLAGGRTAAWRWVHRIAELQTGWVERVPRIPQPHSTMVALSSSGSTGPHPCPRALQGWGTHTFLSSLCISSAVIFCWLFLFFPPHPLMPNSKNPK